MNLQTPFQILSSVTGKRCRLRPFDEAAAIALYTQPDAVEAIPDQFGICPGGECQSCNIYQKHQRSCAPRTTTGCLRQDSDGRWWILNEQQSGWKSHGYMSPTLPQLLTVWAIVLDQKQHDQFGELWTYKIGRITLDAS